MSNQIKFIAGGEILQGSILDIYTNNTGAPQLVYVLLGQNNGASSIVELSNSDTVIDNSNRIIQVQVNDGQQKSVPVIVVPDGEKVTGQAAAPTADCHVGLFASEQTSGDLKRIFLAELASGANAITTDLSGNGKRVICNFANDNAGTNRSIIVSINGTEMLSFQATIGDTKSVELYLGFNDTLSIDASGAGVTCSIYEIPTDIEIALLNGELVV